jgi:hypothetical protein
MTLDWIAKESNMDPLLKNKRPKYAIVRDRPEWPLVKNTIIAWASFPVAVAM